jgi:hypothetical protein
MAIFWIAFFLALAAFGLAGLGPDTRDTRYSMRVDWRARPTEDDRGAVDIPPHNTAVEPQPAPPPSQALRCGTAKSRADGIVNIAPSPRSSADRAGAF